MEPLPPSERPRGRPDSELTLPAGLEAGLAGAVAVVVVFLVRDLANGDWLRTPSVLGTLLLEGPDAARSAVSNSGIAAVYHALHFAVWTIAGFVGSGLMTLAERRPAARFLPPVALLAALAGAAALNGLLSDTGLGTLHLWLGTLAGGVAISAYLVWRHPGVFGREVARSD